MTVFLTLHPLDVLVSTRRVVGRFEDLLPDEVADLFLCAHRVGPVVQRVFGGTSLTISMQVRPVTEEEGMSASWKDRQS